MHTCLSVRSSFLRYTGGLLKRLFLEWPIDRLVPRIEKGKCIYIYTDLFFLLTLLLFPTSFIILFT